MTSFGPRLSELMSMCLVTFHLPTSPVGQAQLALSSCQAQYPEILVEKKPVAQGLQSFWESECGPPTRFVHISYFH